MSASSLHPETLKARPSDGNRDSSDETRKEFERASSPDAVEKQASRLDPTESTLSPWACSPSRRVFDCVCVLLALPMLLAVFLLVALAIRCTSRGPVFFLQRRIGRHRRAFTIFKFRTMTHVRHSKRSAVTTTQNQTFTPVGPFLRRWKLDELPQLLNVLLGDMSLVGPRPKLPAHQVADLWCRPGITGAATIAFVHEEQLLACVPHHHLDEFYRETVLPLKHQLDSDYMASATFASDVKMLFNSALRRWDIAQTQQMLGLAGFGAKEGLASASTASSIQSAGIAEQQLFASAE